MPASVLSCSAASVQWYYDPDSEGRPRGPEGASDCTRMIRRCFVAPIMALSGVVMDFGPAAGEPHDSESPESGSLRLPVTVTDSA